MSGIYIASAGGELKLATQNDIDEMARTVQCEQAMRMLFARIVGEPHLANRRRMIFTAMTAIKELD